MTRSIMYTTEHSISSRLFTNSPVYWGAQEEIVKRYLLALMLSASLLVLFSQAALAAPPEQGGGNIHYVRSGETLDSIAMQYGVSTEAIMRYNGIINPDLIFVGQPITIPGGGYGPPMGYPNPGYSCGVNVHVVKFGETLSSIAWKYGTSVEQLMRMNNIFNPDLVYVGQPLCVPGGYAPQPPVMWPQPAYNPAPPPPSPCGCNTPNCGNCPPPIPAPQPRPEPPCGCGAPNCGECPPPPPPSSCGCDGHDCKSAKPCIEIRHLTQEYEQWHRPANGLAACVNEDGPYDIIEKPVTRFTIGIWLVNNGSKDIPGSWAYNPSVVIETKNGQWREACVWNPGTFNPLAKANGGKSVVVTFFTHLEQGDYVKDIHFLGLPGAPCFDPGNESVKSCNPVAPPPGTFPEMAFPAFPPGATDLTPDTVFSSHS